MSDTYRDTSGATHQYPKTGVPPVESDPPISGSAPAQPVSPEDLARDTLGFTNPNLHRRIDVGTYNDKATTVNVRTTSGTKITIKKGQEIDPREYNLQIQGTNSYRTVKYTLYEEGGSKTSEIP